MIGSARVEPLAHGTVDRIAQGVLSVSTRGQAMTDVTAPIVRWVREQQMATGMFTAFVQHTTASLMIQENADDRVQDDLVSALDRLAPVDAPYTHADEGPDDMPGHIKAMVCGPSVTVPCVNGTLALGTWQAIYLVEHRDRPRTRTLLITLLGR